MKTQSQTTFVKLETFEKKTKQKLCSEIVKMSFPLEES